MSNLSWAKAKRITAARKTAAALIADGAARACPLDIPQRPMKAVEMGADRSTRRDGVEGRAGVWESRWAFC